MKRFRLLAVLLLVATSSIAAEPVATSPVVTTSIATLMQRILKAADKSNDGKLSVEEYKTLDVQAKHHGDEHFKASDTNSDGFIDATELAGALKKQTWFAILSEGTEICFQRLDLNKDARIDAMEYRKVSKMGGHSEQHFNGADTNKDGFLDLTEFTAHAEHKLAALESDLPRKKRPKK